jgi:HK97 family phage portal protein
MTITERFLKLFGYRAPTQRARTYMDPALTAYFGGAVSSAGVSVDEISALNFSPVWQAVRIVSETVATLPIHVYRRDTDGRRRADDLLVADLLRWEPNPEMTSTQFREAWVAHALTWGNGFAEIERDSLGRAMRIWLLLPNAVTVTRDPAGNVIYLIRHESGQQVALPQSDVLHLAGPGFDGLIGYSVISKARESIGLGLACEQFGSSMFGSGARPSGILEHPGRLSDDARARLRGDFERLHAGIDNAHRVAVLEEGLKWTQTSIPPDDAQFLQTRAYQIEEIARWFNIPVSKLRIKDGGSYASLEQENSAFLTECLRPWLVRIEQEVRRKLLLPESSALYVEHNVDGLLRTDLASRYQAYSIGRNWGWLSVNEVRALEQLEPVEGGDTYMMPMNMMPMGTQPGPVAPASSPATTEQPIEDGSPSANAMNPSETRAIPRRYGGIEFVPPQGVRNAARQGLEWRREHNRGGTAVGVARARDLSNGIQISPETIRRMVSYFARHEVDKQGEGWAPGQDGFPSAGRIAWALWGDDEGRRWAEKISGQMDRADELEG